MQFLFLLLAPVCNIAAGGREAPRVLLPRLILRPGKLEPRFLLKTFGRILFRLLANLFSLLLSP